VEDVHGKQKEASTDTARECQDMFQVSCFFSRALFLSAMTRIRMREIEGERERKRKGGWERFCSALSIRPFQGGDEKEDDGGKREKLCVNTLCRGDPVVSWGLLLLLSAAPAPAPFQWQMHLC